MASSIPQELLEINADNELYHHHIVWLDKNLENYRNQRVLNELKEIDPAVTPFTCEEKCIDYIQKNEKDTICLIIFIISGALSQKIIPKVHDCKYILGFFIFCKNVEDYAHLKFSKLRAIYDDKRELMDTIEVYITRNSIRQIDFSVLNDQKSTLSESKLSNAQYPIRNLKEDEIRFLWFHQWHNYMIKLENDDDQEAKNELVSFCRQQFDDNRIQLAIDEFNNQSLEDNAKYAIWWYTKNSFLFRCVNKVLRTESISHIYSFRYIIKLLCRQLEKLHKKFVQKFKERKKENTTICLYRGQQLESSELTLLKNNIGNLVSLNGFVSTSLDQDVAMRFISAHSREGMERVLIEIDVDVADEQSVAFADIRKFSQYINEEEILISIGSVFCIKSINYDDNMYLYRIRLSLSQQAQLTVNKYIKHTYADDADSVDHLILFGKLLFDMGEHELALKHFTDTSRRLSDTNNHIRATCLNNIGMCHNGLGKRMKAFKYYEKALEIYKKEKNLRGMGTCYHNMASIYLAEGQDELALMQALNAQDNREKYPLERASTFDLLGCIYLAKRDVDAARNNFQDSLKIRLKCWSKINPNHPDIGTSYQNLGGVDSRASHYNDAYDNYSQAVEIYRHNYPKSHPLIKKVKSLKDAMRHLRG